MRILPLSLSGISAPILIVPRASSRRSHTVQSLTGDLLPCVCVYADEVASDAANGAHVHLKQRQDRPSERGIQETGPGSERGFAKHR